MLFRRFCAACTDSLQEAGQSASIPDLGLLKLRTALDRQIVGHSDTKDAVLLGLVAREHVYIEGPPGIGKTQLAEAAAEAAGLTSFFYQFHRDTRVNELVGDATIVREQTEEGEIIRQGVRPGGVLTADVCILDDISRSPGEALNVLLRLLNERKFGGHSLPLRCAVATGNPTNEEFFNEPLDPAVLDRFTLQISAAGLVKGSDWEAAARVIREHGIGGPLPGAVSTAIPIDALTAEQWEAYDQALTEVVFPDKLMEALLEVLGVLVRDHGLGQAHPALLTDRTFLVKAPRIMRAHAMLEGRQQCTEEDLYVLRLLTRFRVPQPVHDRITDIISEVLENQKQDKSNTGSGQPGPDGSGAGQQASNKSSAEAGAASASQDLKQTQCNDAAPGALYQLMEPLRYFRWFLNELLGHPPPLINKSQVQIEGAEALIQSLRGSLQRSTADLWSLPGGLPRRWQSMRCLTQVEDADMSSLALWCSSPSAVLPRVALRQRVERGGAMAIVRDISDSMSRPRQEYLLARCASSVIQRVIDLAKRNHMRIGYSEFADRSWKHFTGGSRFFTRDYSGIQSLAQNLQTRGSTHYQLALREVLQEFERFTQARGFGQRLHAVMLSDGEPTLGCLDLHEERAWAQRIRVCVHTIFIGEGAYPPVLANLAADTGGKRFRAIPRYDLGNVRVLDVSHEPIPEVSRWRTWMGGVRNL